MSRLLITVIALTALSACDPGRQERKNLLIESLTIKNDVEFRNAMIEQISAISPVSFGREKLPVAQ